MDTPPTPVVYIPHKPMPELDPPTFDSQSFLEGQLIHLKHNLKESASKIDQAEEALQAWTEYRAKLIEVIHGVEQSIRILKEAACPAESDVEDVTPPASTDP